MNDLTMENLKNASKDELLREKERLEKELHTRQQELNQAEQESAEFKQTLHNHIMKLVKDYGLEKAKEMASKTNCYDFVDWERVSKSFYQW